MAGASRFTGKGLQASEKHRFENVIRSAYRGDIEENLVENIVDFVPLLFSKEAKKIEKAWTSIAILVSSEVENEFSTDKLQGILDSALRKMRDKIFENRDMQRPDLQYLSPSELKLFICLLENVGEQRYSDIVKRYFRNEYVPNRKQADKVLEEKVDSLFNKFLAVLFPEQRLKVSNVHRKYEVMFSDHAHARKKKSSWQYDGTLVVKSDKVELYDNEKNLRDTKTVDSRNFVSALHEGGIFTTFRYQVIITKVIDGYEKGKDMLDNSGSILPAVSSLKRSSELLKKPCENAETPDILILPNRSTPLVNVAKNVPIVSDVGQEIAEIDLCDEASKLIRRMSEHQVRNLWHNIPKRSRLIMMNEEFKFEGMYREEIIERKRKRIASDEPKESTFDIDEFINA